MPTITYSFSNIVPEFVVNHTTANNQLLPDVVTLSNGDLFFTFDTDSPGNAAFQDVMFRRFASTGSALDNIDQLVSAGILTDDEEDSAIAILADGNVAIVNEDNDGGTDDDVEFHIYTSAGAVVSNQNIVTQAEGQASDSQTNPRVAALARGGFVVVYVDQFSGSATNTNAEFVIFNNDGTLRAGPVIAGGALTALSILDPAVTALRNNTFVVTWREDIGAGDFNVKFRVFSPSGVAISPELTVSIDGDDQSQPAIAALPGGGFALVIRDQLDGSVTDSELELRIYDASGTQVGPVQRIDPGGTDLLLSPDVALISDNLLLVSYTSTRNGNDDIFGQLFTLSGTPVGPEFNLEVISGSQGGSALSSTGGGRFVAAWQDSAVVAGVDVSGFHVAAQVTQVIRDTTGDVTDEVLTGDDLPDVIRGNGGDDLIDGGDGDDTAVYAEIVNDYRFDFIGGDLRVTDLRSGAPDGADTLRATEHLQFANATLAPLFGTAGDDNIVAAGSQAINAGVGNDTVDFGFAWSMRRSASPAMRCWSNPAPTTSWRAASRASCSPTARWRTTTAVRWSTTVLLFAQSRRVERACRCRRALRCVRLARGPRPERVLSTRRSISRLNPDVQAAGANPLAHFDTAGWQQGRVGSIAFSAPLYLAANPDVAAAQVDPLAHFLSFGAQRRPRALRAERAVRRQRLRLRLLSAAQSGCRGGGRRSAAALPDLRLAGRAQSERAVRRRTAIARPMRTSPPRRSIRSTTTTSSAGTRDATRR